MEKYLSYKVNEKVGYKTVHTVCSQPHRTNQPKYAVKMAEGTGRWQSAWSGWIHVADCTVPRPSSLRDTPAPNPDGVHASPKS